VVSDTCQGKIFLYIIAEKKIVMIVGIIRAKETQYCSKATVIPVFMSPLL